MTYPVHIRKTAVWLYTRHELSCQEVADRLEVSFYAARSWVEAAKVLRSKGAKYSIAYEKTGLREKQIRAYNLSEMGVSQREIARELNVSVRTIYRYRKRAKDFLSKLDSVEKEHNIAQGYARFRCLAISKDLPPNHLLAILTPKEQVVIRSRHNGDLLNEIAAELSLTEARICQIEAEARKKLERYLEPLPG